MSDSRSVLRIIVNSDLISCRRCLKGVLKEGGEGVIDRGKSIGLEFRRRDTMKHGGRRWRCSDDRFGSERKVCCIVGGRGEEKREGNAAPCGYGTWIGLTGHARKEVIHPGRGKAAALWVTELPG